MCLIFLSFYQFLIPFVNHNVHTRPYICRKSVLYKWKMPISVSIIFVVCELLEMYPIEKKTETR